HTITVTTPSPGGGTSSGVTLTITGPTLTVATTIAPGATFNVTLANGPGLVADWVGLYCPATSPDPGYIAWKYLSNAQTLPPSGVTDVTLTFTAPTAVGTTCEARWWSGMVKLATSATMTVANPVPTITALSPASLAAGSAAFTLTVNGTGFVPGADVQLDGASRTTTFMSSTQV